MHLTIYIPLHYHYYGVEMLKYLIRPKFEICFFFRHIKPNTWYDKKYSTKKHTLQRILEYSLQEIWRIGKNSITIYHVVSKKRYNDF